MVKIIGTKVMQRKNGEQFSMLVVQGGLEPILSKKTGKIYFTMRTANVSTTMDNTTCLTLVGTELPGSVEKRNCEPYQYFVQETGELLILTHNWQYVDEEFVNANSQMINDEKVN